MEQRPRIDRDSEVLAEPAATRLLARASELDAALRGGAALADLRAAAAEAGISADAFEAALAELRQAERAPAPAVREPPQHLRRWSIAAGVAILVASMVAVAGRPPAPTSVPMSEQSFLVRCLSPSEAAELIRPLLRLPQNSVVIAPERGTRVVTVRGTPAQVDRVKALLEKYDGGDASASPRCQR